MCHSVVIYPSVVAMPWANPPNMNWSRWGEEKKRTVSVQGRARKATDSGGDEEKNSAPDRQQLDPPAQQQQCLQGAHLCRGPPEEVGVTRGGLHCASDSCFVVMSSLLNGCMTVALSEMFFLQVWVSGQPGYFASILNLVRYVQLPSSALCCWLLCPE